MARPQRPQIDLSNCNYDELETTLAENLGLKVMLFGSGWKLPNEYHTAQANITFAVHGGGTEEQRKQAVERAREKFSHVESMVLMAMRSIVRRKDKDLEASITDNDLRSLLKVGHVTIRKGNAEPEEAVIVFDPKPEADEFSSYPELSHTLTDKCENGWREMNTADKGRVVKNYPVADIIENFDLSADDIRAYQAVINTWYALRNQSEYNNLGKQWYYQPDYYTFSSIAGEDTAQIYRRSEWPYIEQMQAQRLEQNIGRHPDRWGIKDPDFIDKLNKLHAINSLVWPASPAYRVYISAGLDISDVKEVSNFHRELGRIRDQEIKARFQGPDHMVLAFMLSASRDFRVIFPLFREFYEQDESNGSVRRYLDAVWDGLQTFFPTITNAPVPALDPDKEPPRTLADYRNSGPAPQGPQP